MEKEKEDKRWRDGTYEWKKRRDEWTDEQEKQKNEDDMGRGVRNVERRQRRKRRKWKNGKKAEMKMGNQKRGREKTN